MIPTFLVEFLRIFEEKLRKGKTRVGLLCCSEGTHAAVKLFATAWAALPRRSKMAKMATHGFVGTIHKEKFFDFVSESPVFVPR